MEIHAFQWDEGNLEHISIHGVSPGEIEEIAFKRKPHIRKGREGKRYLYGKTLDGRYLFVVYVFLGRGKVRVITARDMDSKERDFM